VSCIGLAGLSSTASRFLRLGFLWFREENFVLVGPTFVTFRVDAISPTADPSMDDGVSSLSVRNGVLDRLIIDEHFGMGFSGTWHDPDLLAPGSCTVGEG